MGPIAIHRSYFCLLLPDLYRLGYHTTSSVGTVIRGHIKISGYRFHFLFQDQKILGLASYDNICSDSMLMQPFHLGIYRCCSYTTCNEEDLLDFTSSRGCSTSSEGRPKGLQNHGNIPLLLTVPSFWFPRLPSGTQLWWFLFSVVITDSQRDSLSFTVHSYDDKLTGFTGLRHSFASTSIR